jgi:hypothetical protein
LLELLERRAADGRREWLTPPVAEKAEVAARARESLVSLPAKARFLDERPGAEVPASNAALSEETRLLVDFPFFARRGLEIVYRPGLLPQAPGGGFGPFILTSAQEKLVALIVDKLLVQKVPLRLALLKSRQLGCTTLLLAVWVWLLLTRDHYHVMFIIDKDKHGVTKREMVVGWLDKLRRRYDFLPKLAKREDKLLFLENGSKLFFESAESPNPGTSEMLHVLHESEKPKWPARRAQQVEESVTPGLPLSPYTAHVDESTACGVDDFKKKWDRAVARRSAVVPVFLPWFVSHENQVAVPPGFQFLDEDEEVADATVDARGEEVVLRESEYARQHKLSPAQVLWRREKIKTQFRGNRVSFDQEYPTTPGHAWRAAVGGFFPGGWLAQVEKQGVRPPMFQGRIVDLHGYEDFHAPQSWLALVPRLVPARDGELLEWEEPRAEEEYFLGADVAEGKSVTSEQGEVDPDYTVFSVVGSDGREVALYRARLRPEEAWLPLVLLARRWNDAWVNGERNGPGLVLLSFFARTGYVHPLVHARPAERPVQDRTWTTVGPTNREALLLNLRAAVTVDPRRVRSEEFLAEARTFTRRTQGRQARFEAAAGAHDDVVFALAHAQAARRWRQGAEVVAGPEVECLQEEEPAEVGGFRLEETDWQELEF